MLAKHLRDLVWRRIPELPELSTPVDTALPSWKGSPYPGLRAFLFEEAAIFFGRGRETDALIARLRDPDQRFLAVVGASGTGKSSLVRAGLLPRLAAGAIEGSQNWQVLTFTPGAFGDNPFLALAGTLAPVLPAAERKPPAELATALTKTPQRITEYAAMILAGRPAGAVLMLFVDQLEELFTLVTATHQVAFIDLLMHATDDPRLRVLVTLRADSLPRCAAEPCQSASKNWALPHFRCTLLTSAGEMTTFYR